MPTLELDNNDAAVLKESLESVVSDLGYEIANTDSKDFRDNLKQKRELLKRLAGELGSA